MSDLFSLEDKTVVITGGLGQLGRCYAHALLDAGANVALWDVDVETRLNDPSLRVFVDHPSVMAVECDITDRASVEAAAETVAIRYGTPHGLINNAALDSPPGAPASENGPFESYPEESWKRVMDVNVNGVFFCCQVVGKMMADAGRGSIVNVSSTYGVVSPNQDIYEYRREQGETFYKPAAYSASKSALINFTRYLATYWAKQGVRANTLVLGGVFNHQDEAFLAEYAKRVPMGRMADENEYNGAVLFLLSEASSYMTGSQLVMDGGWTAW